MRRGASVSCGDDGRPRGRRRRAARARRERAQRTTQSAAAAERPGRRAQVISCPEGHRVGAVRELHRARHGGEVDGWVPRSAKEVRIPGLDCTADCRARERKREARRHGLSDAEARDRQEAAGRNIGRHPAAADREAECRIDEPGRRSAVRQGAGADVRRDRGKLDGAGIRTRLKRAVRTARTETRKPGEHGVRRRDRVHAKGSTEQHRAHGARLHRIATHLEFLWDLARRSVVASAARATDDLGYAP